MNERTRFNVSALLQLVDDMAAISKDGSQPCLLDQEDGISPDVRVRAAEAVRSHFAAMGRETR